MSRLRAVEHGRWVLVAATSGVSATIAPDGTVVQRAEIFTAAQIVQQVGCRTRSRLPTGWVPFPRSCSRSSVSGRSCGRVPSVAPTPTASRRPNPTDGRGRAAVNESADSEARGPCRTTNRRLSPASWCASRPTTRPRTCSGSSAGYGPPYPTRTCSSPTTTARTARVCSPIGSPARTTTSTCCTGPARRVSGPPTSTPSRGPSTGATTSSSRWTQTGRTALRSCPRCSQRSSPAPTWCSAPVGCEGGRVVNWPRSREVISRGGNTYARLALGISLRDATGGYRAFRAATLKEPRPGRRSSRRATASRSTSPAGPSSSASRSPRCPITFVEREAGVSKMSARHRRRGVVARHGVGRQDSLGPGQDLGQKARPGRSDREG